MSKAKIFTFSGSYRKASYNQQLVNVAAGIARSEGFDVTEVSLKDYPLPLFDEDLELEGYPPNALKLRKIFLEHQGFILSCPEYNGSLTPLLKNTIDWMSRTVNGKSGLKCFQNKTVLLLSASPGAFGGLRGVLHVRTILMQLQALVLPNNFGLPKAHEAFDESGKLKDSKTFEALAKSVAQFKKISSRLGVEALA